MSLEKDNIFLYQYISRTHKPMTYKRETSTNVGVRKNVVFELLKSYFLLSQYMYLTIYVSNNI